MTGITAAAALGGVLLAARIAEEREIRELASPDAAVREAAAIALAAKRCQRAVPALIRALNEHRHDRSGAAALRALLRIAGAAPLAAGKTQAFLDLDGSSPQRIESLFGRPHRTSRVTETYGRGRDWDEQWTYAAELDRLVIYFNAGVVAGARHEWSDLGR